VLAAVFEGELQTPIALDALAVDCKAEGAFGLEDPMGTGSRSRDAEVLEEAMERIEGAGRVASPFHWPRPALALIPEDHLDSEAEGALRIPRRGHPGETGCHQPPHQAIELGLVDGALRPSEIGPPVRGVPAGAVTPERLVTGRVPQALVGRDASIRARVGTLEKDGPLVGSAKLLGERVIGKTRKLEERRGAGGAGDGRHQGG